MKKTLISIIMVAFVILSACGKSKTSLPAEGPEEVVTRFYAYLKEGGPTTLGEAYRLISTKRYTMYEDIFKDTAKKYPKDLEIKVIGSIINEKEERAVVTIEYKAPSAFGGYFTSQTDVALELDKESKSWKIDFTGETYEENPSMYAG
ncbi:MAG: hypothetical protein HY880_05315 [Deltaproteobacteria bacterium]|nr:hypothetical protein [Deltaproteobacteria bacterium]